MHQLQQPGLAAHLQDLAVEQIGFCRKRAVGFHPAQVIFLFCFNSGVAQPLGVIARHHPLQGREKRLDEFLLLVVQVLADALGHRHGGAFELQHAQRDAIDVDHHVRALAAGFGRIGQVGAPDRHLFSNRKVVVLRRLPVNQPHRDPVFTRAGLHLHAVTQQLIHLAVAVVKALAGIGGGLVQLVQRAGDQGGAHVLFGQPCRE